MADDTTKKAGQPTKILGNAAPEHWWDEMVMLRERIAALEVEKKALQDTIRNWNCPMCTDCPHEMTCKR